MPNIQKMQSEFTIKFDGQLHQVDVNTLISSLISTSTVLQEINKELEPNNNLEVKIVALSEGSFEINYAIQGLATILPLLPTIVSKNNLEYAKVVIEILAQLFGLKKILQEDEPKSVTETKDGQVIVETNNGTINVWQYTYNLYARNQLANDAMSKGFEALTQDPNISDFKMLDPNGGVIFSATKADFQGMSTKRNIPTEKTKSEVDENAQLNIFKLVFETKYKWEFYYKGNKISAIIQDENFYHKIDQGEKFSKGDILLVKLKINQIYEPSVDAYVNESYEVIEVTGHKPRAVQEKLLD